MSVATSLATTSATISGRPALTASDLAELMSAFNDVTGRLEATHESLRREVARLQGELREANEQLERSRRLAALGEMAAGIAHEVRNPLGSIRLYARMLEQDLTDRPGERQIAGKIAAAVYGLDGVVGDVLTFARELRSCPQEVEPAEVFDRALESCFAAESASGSGIRVERGAARKRGPGRAGVLWCDPALMHRAMVNIIQNAVQAMGESPPPEGGHRLLLESGTAEETQGRAMFSLSVTDTGPGVSDEVIERMFNPFFTTRAAGTGLGLAIVHRIVDAHSGRIVVRNGPDGRGAKVELLLPGRPAVRVRAVGTGNGRGAEGPGGKARSVTEQETAR